MKLDSLDGRRVTFAHADKSATFTIPEGDAAYQVARILVGAKRHFTGDYRLTDEDIDIGKELVKCVS